MSVIVPEVIGAPTPQGVVIIQANNRPVNIDEKDHWAVPAHTPVFAQDNDGPTDRAGVVNVTAHQDSVPTGEKVVGVSLDGVYDTEIQKSHMHCEGANRFSMAVAGVVTLASTPSDNNKFVYGDPVYIKDVAQVERLHSTKFKGALQYDPSKSGDRPSVGTFVCPVGPEGGMRVLTNFDL